MEKILFVCHGNICRSAMAKFVMQDLVNRNGLQDEYEIDSAAVSREEIGNDMYPPAKAKLREKGIPFSRHRARQITKADLEYFDKIILMDRSNLRWMERMFGRRNGKIEMLLERDVADPWYTDDFEATYQDLQHGCRRLLHQRTDS